ncbi:hypothetical protein PIB30_014271 [Stylosanthes scabra]|uniref:Uncharacterized protein n=1 Tax=Stylosanthes scabra TaxID=79078 RepID=A0ABU6Z750_9FABA|nr:hypothetical protein [Stylosanthes scabra]
MDFSFLDNVSSSSTSFLVQVIWGRPFNWPQLSPATNELEADVAGWHFAVVSGELGTVKGKQGDSDPSSIIVSDEACEFFSQPYKDAVVIKVLDKHLSYTSLIYKLKGVWKLRGGFDLLMIEIMFYWEDHGF